MTAFKSVLAILLSAGALVTPAGAVVFTVAPVFDASIGVGLFPPTPLGAPAVHEKQIVTDSSGTHYSQLDGVLETDPGGGFFFENSHVGTGTSFSAALTELAITVTNDGRVRQALRLDSQITPGHIAARDGGGSDPEAGGSFLFLISEGEGTLYETSATIRPKGLQFATSPDQNGVDTFSMLNGLRRTQIGNALAYDWGATNISIDLGIFGAGETRTFSYYLATYVNIFAPVNSAAGSLADRCDSVQVSFGDPRSRGGSVGGSAIVAASASAGPPAPVPDPTGCDVDRVNPLIGLEFGPYSVPISIVPIGSPLPVQPPAPPPVDYTTAPEPAAIALFGLGALGVARRRRG